MPDNAWVSTSSVRNFLVTPSSRIGGCMHNNTNETAFRSLLHVAVTFEKAPPLRAEQEFQEPMRSLEILRGFDDAARLANRIVEPGRKQDAAPCTHHRPGHDGRFG